MILSKRVLHGLVLGLITCVFELGIAAEQAAPPQLTRIMESYPLHVQRRLDKQRVAAVPAGSREETQAVFNKLKLWKAGQLLRICFFSGSAELRERIARAALPWTTAANLRFDFGSISSPRDCDGGRSDIRIGFDQKGYWSVIGNDSITLMEQWESSINLEAYPVNPPTEPDFSSTVLHEFGHAIGFHHEHQHPFATCDFDLDKVVEQLTQPPNNWEPGYAKEQLVRLNENDVQTIGKLDVDSIMLYHFDEWMYKLGSKSSCYTSGNYALSKIDREAALTLYPKDVGIAELTHAQRRSQYDALVNERASATQRELARAQADLMTAPAFTDEDRIRIRDAILRR